MKMLILMITITFFNTSIAEGDQAFLLKGSDIAQEGSYSVTANGEKDLQVKLAQSDELKVNCFYELSDKQFSVGQAPKLVLKYRLHSCKNEEGKIKPRKEIRLVFRYTGSKFQFSSMQVFIGIKLKPEIKNLDSALIKEYFL